jgi:hypothetical protein
LKILEGPSSAALMPLLILLEGAVARGSLMIKETLLKKGTAKHWVFGF